MKALILSDYRPSEDKNASDLARFEKMIRALAKGGVESAHSFIGTAAETMACVESSRPDLVFSAAHYTTDSGSGRRNVHEFQENAGILHTGSPPAIIDLVRSKPELEIQV